jgi:hypothetical protein
MRTASSSPPLPSFATLLRTGPAVRLPRHTHTHTEWWRERVGPVSHKGAARKDTHAVWQRQGTTHHCARGLTAIVCVCVVAIIGVRLWHGLR